MKRFAILTPVLALSLTTAVHAGVLAPKFPSQVVTLATSGASCAGGTTRVLDRRVMPDSTVTVFSIPAGQVLVVTAVDWAQTGPFTVGNASAQLIIGSSSLWIDAAAIQGGFAIHTAAVANAVVKSGTPLCFGVDGAVNQLSVHGFLTTDK